MNDMTKEDVNERIKIFKSKNIYTYIKNIYFKFFNGYITEIKNELIIFKDDILGEIPIQIKEIKEIDYSFKKKNE